MRARRENTPTIAARVGGGVLDGPQASGPSTGKL